MHNYIKKQQSKEGLIVEEAFMISVFDFQFDI